MTHKIHFRQGIHGTTACASRGTRANGTIIRNSRRTYQTMGAVAVGVDEFRETPAEQRCAHCCNRFTAVLNARRAKNGKPLYKDAMTRELQA